MRRKESGFTFPADPVRNRAKAVGLSLLKLPAHERIEATNREETSQFYTPS
jgi:hypothetical protein